jgi:hypothetical protein
VDGVLVSPGLPVARLPGHVPVEREEEVRTLTDPRVRETVDHLGLELASYADFAARAAA